jgi:23S rRNA pseudouridine1911/1915/1917 synthase
MPDQMRFSAETSGERLDAFVAAQAPELSRARVQGLIRDGKVQVNGRQEKASYRVQVGDAVTVEIPPPVEPEGALPENIPLDIVYQDADLAVIDKPAGMVVHPGAGNRTGTLVNALLYQIRDLSGIGGELRPGIVHRLDKDTSGLLIVAKNDAAHRALAEMIERREVKREYLALAWDTIDEEAFTVDAPIGRHPSERQRMAVLADERLSGTRRRAVTHFTVLERMPHATALSATLETGRTHQIRVHLHYIGHPVVGDPVYGARAARHLLLLLPPAARAAVEALPGQALHAHRLTFPHPRTGEPLAFTADPPLHFTHAWEALREK